MTPGPPQFLQTSLAPTHDGQNGGRGDGQGSGRHPQLQRQRWGGGRGEPTQPTSPASLPEVVPAPGPQAGVGLGRWRQAASIGAVTVVLVMAAGVLAAPSAAADPIVPPGASAGVRALAEANARAADALEAWTGAREQLTDRQRDAEGARAAAEGARAAAGQARAEMERAFVEVDRLTAATYQGGRLDPASALLGSDNPRDYVARAALLDAIAAQTQTAMRRFTDAAAATAVADRAANDRATAADQAAAEARTAVDDATRRFVQAERDIAAADTALRQAGPADRAALRAGGTTTYPTTALDAQLGDTGGGGVAVAALRVALTQQGKPYVWGAAGPNSFDCSGLVQWSYRQIGVGIPKYSGAQAEVGQAIAPADARPGDLLFFNTPVSHVGIYLGGGRFVEAPQSGDVVKVSAVRANLSGIRRISL